ncbi:Processive diacylglycerol beta-glucosyltransferase [Clostridium felsineum DSM 794]|nr:Processive diacylglycerol beta-glucosyltransferase [Clostridium felsineum DSM 794]
MILAAQTGHGHMSVMNAINEAFLDKKYKDCICIPDFYESILPSNKILSDFYNFLLSSSTALCDKYVEFNSITRPEKNEYIYKLTKHKYTKLFRIKGIDAIISTATSINYNMIRAMKEERILNKIPFYVVVTDPYNPIAPGFDAIGATRYFCPNSIVRKILVKSGVPEKNVIISGYPISKRFFCDNLFKNEEIYTDLNINKDKKVIVLNCGSQGNISNLDFLIKYLNSNLHENFIMLCGVNKVLYKLAKIELKRAQRDNVTILPFYDHVEKLLAVADIYITKAGANSFYEALVTKVPMIIDAVNGFIYQERGVVDFLENAKVGRILRNKENLISLIKTMLSDKESMRIKEEYKQILIKDGANNIVEKVLEDIGKL